MVTMKPYAVLALVLALAGVAAAEESGDRLKKGAQAYRLCAACHSLQPGVHLSGPSLAGLWGRRSATIDDFGRYTRALKKLEVTWDEYALDPWVTNPQVMAPGTTMIFRGVKDDATREQLIAFLRVALTLGGADKAVSQGLISAPVAQGQLPPDHRRPAPISE